jgi:magnesium chelatase family protein
MSLPIEDISPTRDRDPFPDLAAVWGREPAKRAMEVAVAGGHSLLLVGPTGAGKSLLARCLPSLLPPLAPEEAAAVAEVHARAGQAPPFGRPVRAPGADVSAAGLLGDAGAGQRPGEAGLAVYGVLILDDLAALRRVARQALCALLDRQGHRDHDHARPAVVAAALRPCPCGGLALPDTACGCTPALLRRHLARIDGALLDRFDLQVDIPSLSNRELTGGGETGSTVAARVAAARRYRTERGGPAAFEPACRGLLAAALARLGLSARALDRVRQVACTIADLAGSAQVRATHLAEALQYRTCESLARARSGPP